MDAAGGCDLWQTNKTTANEAIDVLGLPCCLKVQESPDQGLTDGGFLLQIHKRIALPCVRLLLVPQESDGDEVFNKDDAEEEEVLVPLGYQGPVVLADELAGIRYSNVAELIKDFPNFVTVDAELVLTENFRILQPGSVMQLIKVEHKKRGCDMLVCLEKGTEVKLKSTWAISCTALSKKVDMTLRELAENIPLPRNVKFHNLSSAELVQFCISRKVTTRILSSIVTVQRVEERRVLVGLKATENGSPNLYIIPDDKFGESDLCSKSLKNLNCQYFPHSDFDGTFLDIQKRLYVMPVSKLSKDLPKRSVSVPGDRPELPPRPEFQSQLSLESRMNKKEEGSFSFFLEAAKRTKAKLGNVQSGLKEVVKPFLKKIGKNNPSADLQAEEDDNKSSQNQSSSLPKQKTGHKLSETWPFSALKPGKKRSPLNFTCEEFMSSNPEDRCEQKDHYDKISLGDGSTTKDKEWPARKQIKEENDQAEKEQDYDPIKLAHELSRSEEGGRYVKERSEKDYKQDSKEEDPYEDVSLGELFSRKADVQTNEYDTIIGPVKEFFGLTVEGLTERFMECGMEELAKICKEERLDGTYFKHLTKKDLANEPFSLSRFHRDKVQQIVDGWRPLRSNTND